MQDLPVAERLELHPSEEQRLALEKAAGLVGWTVSQYVLSAALDRAERDLYEHAAALGDEVPGDCAEPFVAVVTALG